MDFKQMTEQKSPVGSSTSLTRSRVNFNNVQIFYFNRCQGFSCVPARGGATMGMTARHSSYEEFHVDDYETKRRYERYHLLLKKHNNGKVGLTPELAKKLENLVRGVYNLTAARRRLKQSSGLSVIGEAGTSQLNTDSLQREISNSTEDFKHNYEIYSSVIDGVDFENEISSFLDCCTLERLSIKKRKFLLQKSGIKQIDHNERIDCQAIRESREVCGCSCPDGICLPEYCQCALNNVICQIDNISFPCSCNRRSECANPEGRLEFNQRRVRVHYIHTKMRLFGEGLCDQQMPPQAIRLESDDDNCPSPSNEGKRQRLDISTDPFQSAKSPERSKAQDSLPSFNSTIKGSCLLCDDAEFVEQCVKSFNIPPSTITLSSHWQLLSASGVQTDNEDNGSLLEYSSDSAAHAECSFWQAALPAIDLPSAMDLGLSSGQRGHLPTYLLALDGDGKVSHSSCCTDLSLYDEHVNVAHVEGETTNSNFPTSTDYSACELDVSFDDCVQRPPISVSCVHAGNSKYQTQVVPLAPITSLLPKLSSEPVSTGEARQPCNTPPLDLSARGEVQPGAVGVPLFCEPSDLSPVTVGVFPDHNSAGGITFTAMNEEVRA